MTTIARVLLSCIALVLVGLLIATLGFSAVARGGAVLVAGYFALLLALRGLIALLDRS